MNQHLLLINLLIPLIGLIFIFIIPEKRNDLMKTFCSISTGLQLWIIIQLMLNFNPQNQGIQFVENYNWISNISINLFLGIDGINLLFLIITALILFFITLFPQRKKLAKKHFYILFLLIDIGLFGTFMSLDLFLLFSFLGLALFCAFLLVLLIYNDDIRSIKAFTIFFPAYIVILFGILIIYYQNGATTFNILDLAQQTNQPVSLQIIGMLLIFLGFAPMIPIFPFHSWLTATFKRENPLITTIMAVLVTKIGIYGILRICLPMFPQAINILAVILATFAVINLFYGAISALSQANLTRSIPYLIICQASFILLGIASIGYGFSGNFNMLLISLSGALQHGFNYSLLFFILIVLLYFLSNQNIILNTDKYTTNFKTLPIATTILVIVLLGIVGMPGTAPFISQLLILIGAYNVPVIRVFAIIYILGMSLLILFVLKNLYNIFDSYKIQTSQPYQDIPTGKLLLMLPFILATIFLGLLPDLTLNLITPSLARLINAII